MIKIKIKTILIYLISGVFLLLYSPLSSQDIHYHGVRFIENKNQWEKSLLFKADIPAGQVFIENNAFIYSFYDAQKVKDILSYKFKPNKKIDTILNTTIKCHAYKTTFVGANQNANCSGKNVYDDYLNYYIGNDSSKWARRVRQFETIEIQNLYNGINLKYGNGTNGLKYEFLINSKGNPEDIQIKFEGVKSLRLKNNELIIETSINTIKEQAPFAYQIINGKKQEVQCRFQIKKNIVSFVLPKGYNHKYDLIIDPTLVFSTYSGSFADNWGFTATYDSYGNAYSGGIAFSFGSYPVSTGAFQVTFGGGDNLSYAGGCDIAIIKYNSQGTQRLFGTYLGGLGNDLPHSMIVNENDELLLFGTTGSDNFPTTTNAYDVTFNGGNQVAYNFNSLNFANGVDIFVSKLKNDGTALLASTFIGGTGNDGLNHPSILSFNYADGARGEIMTDNSNNCYIVSTTFSTDFPVTTGVFQPNNAGGQDGCVVKLDQNLSTITWASYLGGSNADAIYGIVLDTLNNLYVTGGTSSLNFPITANALQTNYGGGNSDGFIAKIANDGSSLLHSSYWGSPRYDQSFLIQRSKRGTLYLFGQTADTTNRFIQNAIWNSPKSGQFITKFNAELDAVIWSTTFGTAAGRPDISPTAFMVDLCDKVYISGWGGNINGFGGTNGMPITSDALQNTTDNNDYYFMVMNDDASGLYYGTYFGGVSSEHVDGGTSRFDNKGRIYQSVCAGCGGFDDFPTTPGTWSNVNNSSNCNNALIKLDFSMPSVVADFITPTSGCAPLQVSFINTSIAPSTPQYLWNFGDGTTSNIANPIHTYYQPGVYEISLIITDVTACNFSDTITKRIIVLSNQVDTLSPKTTCGNTPVQIGVPPVTTGNVTYQWFPNTGLSSSTISNPIANVANTTQFMLVINNGSCIDTFYQSVVIVPANIQITPSVINPKCKSDCNGEIAVTIQGLTAPYTYQWSNGVNNASSITNLCAGTYSVTVKDVIGCYKTESYTLTEPDSLKFSITSVVDASCENICNGQATINAYGGIAPYTYQWNNGSSGNMVNNLCAGINTVTVTDNNACTAIGQISITDTSNIQLIVQSNAPTCFESCDGSASASTINGIAPYNYTWSNGETSNTAHQLCAGLINVSVTDASGCIRSQQVNIIAPAAININQLITIEPDCYNECTGNILIAANGGTGSLHYFLNNQPQSSQITQLCAGNYDLKITDDNGCEKLLTININQPTDISTQITKTDIRCEESCIGTAMLNVSGGTPPYTYFWNTGSQSIIQKEMCEGQYSVTISDSHNCKKTENISIEIVPTNYHFDIICPFDTVKEGMPFQLIVNPPNGTAYLWEPSSSLNNPNIANPIATITENTKFTLRVTDEFGCFYYDTLVVYVTEVICQEPYIFIPNSFSPNGDHLNDKFQVKGDVFDTYRISIFDRWGEKVFESTNPQEAWDGTFRGNPCDMGVYVYHLQVTCYDKTTYTKTGNVTLIR